jgi:ankyrin repeat protein
MNGVCDECLEMTGLHCAASNGHLEVLQVFLKAGQNMNQTSATGKTALHYSAMNGHLECCRLLLEAGSDVHVCDSHEQTPLDLAKNLGHHNLTTTLEHTDDGEKLKPVVRAGDDNRGTIDHSVSVASLSHDSSVTDALELPQTVCGQDLQDPSADEPNH